VEIKKYGTKIKFKIEKIRNRGNWDFFEVFQGDLRWPKLRRLPILLKVGKMGKMG